MTYYLCIEDNKSVKIDRHVLSSIHVLNAVAHQDEKDELFTFSKEDDISIPIPFQKGFTLTVYVMLVYLARCSIVGCYKRSQAFLKGYAISLVVRVFQVADMLDAPGVMDVIAQYINLRLMTGKPTVKKRFANSLVRCLKSPSLQ